MLSIETLLGIIRTEATEQTCRHCGVTRSNARDSDRCGHQFGTEGLRDPWGAPADRTHDDRCK